MNNNQKARKSESTLAISSQAPVTRKVAANKPVDIMAAQPFLVSARTIRKMMVNETREARNETSLSGKKPIPKISEASPENQK